MYKIGLIGLGNISSKHITAINANRKNLIFTGGYDNDAQKAISFSQKYGAKLFTNIDELIQENDIVSVLVPHNMHAQLIKKVISKNKICICEKPLCITEDELSDILDVDQNKIFPISQNRYNVAVVGAKEILNKGKLGKINFIQANTFWYRPESYYTNSNWRGRKELEGGILYNQGIHIIDIILYLLDLNSSDCKIKYAYKTNLEQKIKDTESYFKVILEAKDIIIDITVTTVFAKENYLNSIIVSGNNDRLIISGDHLNVLLSQEKREQEIGRDIYGSSHIQSYKEILKYLKSGKGNPVFFKDGLDRVSLIEKIYKATK